jgi:hypothetical protein
MFVSEKDLKLHGEGTGSKEVTDAAYKELSALTASQIAALVAQSQEVKRAAP